MLFHPYNRSDPPPLYFENEVGTDQNGTDGIGEHVRADTRIRSARRVRTVLECDTPPDPEANLHEIERYGTGKERPLAWFYQLFGVDCQNNTKVFDICDFVESGTMHWEYTQYVREDRLGINYNAIMENNGPVEDGYSLDYSLFSLYCVIGAWIGVWIFFILQYVYNFLKGATRKMRKKRAYR